MKSGSCKYEDGNVDSCYECACDECKETVRRYEYQLEDKALQAAYMDAAGANSDYYGGTQWTTIR